MWKHYTVCERMNSSFGCDEHFLNPLLVSCAVCNRGLPVHFMLCHHCEVWVCPLLLEEDGVNVCIWVYMCVLVCMLWRTWNVVPSSKLPWIYSFFNLLSWLNYTHSWFSGFQFTLSMLMDFLFFYLVQYIRLVMTWFLNCYDTHESMQILVWYCFSYHSPLQNMIPAVTAGLFKWYQYRKRHSFK